MPNGVQMGFRCLAVLGRSGTILVCNRQYEAMLLGDAAKLNPDLAADIAQAIARIEDLLPLARESWYHPAMKGSWSLKAVLPAIDPELAYDTLGEAVEITERGIPIGRIVTVAQLAATQPMSSTI